MLRSKVDHGVQLLSEDLMLDKLPRAVLLWSSTSEAMLLSEWRLRERTWSSPTEGPSSAVVETDTVERVTE